MQLYLCVYVDGMCSQVYVSKYMNWIEVFIKNKKFVLSKEHMREKPYNFSKWQTIS